MLYKRPEIVKIETLLFSLKKFFAPKDNVWLHQSV